MKTKTIDVWVSYDEESNLKDDCYVVNNYPQEKDWKCNFKATLTYEVEEPKKSFTESEIRYAIKKGFHNWDDHNRKSQTNQPLDCWISGELFGELDE